MDKQESLFDATPKEEKRQVNIFEPTPLTAYERQKQVRQMTHTNDPSTSKVAADRVFDKMRGLGKLVLVELKKVAPAGYTAEELAGLMVVESTVSGNKVAKVLSMLKGKGLVKLSGAKRPNASGELANEYVII